MKEGLQVNEEEQIHYVKNVIVNKDLQGNSEDFNCIICLNFAYEPLLCSSCETAITCKECFKEYKNKFNQRYKCPMCTKTGSEPKPLLKFFNNVRNNLHVICFKDLCPAREKNMIFSEYLNHIQNCLNKKISCVYNCG